MREGAAAVAAPLAVAVPGNEGKSKSLSALVREFCHE